MGREQYRFDCQEPLTYPYGCMYTSMAQALLVVAWALSLLTINSCYFLESRPIPEDNEPTLAFFGYGFLIRQGGGGNENVVYGKCGRYTDFESEEHIETAWGFATAFGFMALLLGGMISLIILSTCCLSFHDSHTIFLKLAYGTAICFGFQILVFCAYGNSNLCGGTEPTEYICNWGSGSGLNLGAAILWLLSAFLIRLWPIPDKEPVHVVEEPQRQAPTAPKLPQLTMGEQPKPKQQELPKLTNGPRKPRPPANAPRLANEPHKPKRPSSKNQTPPLQITDGSNNKGTSRKPTSGRQPRRTIT